jgi:hypothetical protein
MLPCQFLSLAERLAQANGAAESRSAISRAYYAAYNVGFQFLERMGIPKPKDKCHQALQQRLGASGDAELEQVGRDLAALHARRNRADYQMDHKESENPQNALAVVEESKRIITVFRNCPRYGARWNKIKQAIESFRI